MAIFPFNERVWLRSRDSYRHSIMRRSRMVQRFVALISERRRCGSTLSRISLSKIKVDKPYVLLSSNESVEKSV